MLDEGAGGLCLCIIFPILLLSTKPIFYYFVCYSIWYLYFVLFFLRISHNSLHLHRSLLTGNGYLYVAQDLSMEYSYVYTGIQFCIADRRDSGICTTLTITLCRY